MSQQRNKFKSARLSVLPLCTTTGIPVLWNRTVMQIKETVVRAKENYFRIINKAHDTKTGSIFVLKSTFNRCDHQKCDRCHNFRTEHIRKAKVKPSGKMSILWHSTQPRRQGCQLYAPTTLNPPSTHPENSFVPISVRSVDPITTEHRQQD